MRLRPYLRLAGAAALVLGALVFWAFGTPQLGQWVSLSLTTMDKVALAVIGIATVLIAAGYGSDGGADDWFGSGSDSGGGDGGGD